jgi:hypothetical protein
VTVDDDNVFTITSPSLTFTLLPETGANAATTALIMLGFAEDSESAEVEQEGDAVETIEKEVTVQLTDTTSPVALTETITKTILVISETADHLFSNDNKLRGREATIMNYLPGGHSSWKYLHREAQRQIMEWLDKEGHLDRLGDKLTVKRIQDVEEVQPWATVLALKLIFESLHNSVDDVFKDKAKVYAGEIPANRDRMIVRLDLNQDGTVDRGEQIDTRSCLVVRR